MTPTHGTGESDSVELPDPTLRERGPFGERSARSFDEVLREELEDIREGRRLRGEEGGGGPLPDARSVVEAAHALGTAGLAFSGMGVRSATFNLGVLQGLARLGMLTRFDYLSLTSGGGYVGGWITAWIRRRGLRFVAGRLAGDAVVSDAAPLDGVEPSPVGFLRRFSTYLGPRRGVLSADTWVTLVTSARNLTLNLGVVLLILAAFLLMPRVALLASRYVTGAIEANAVLAGAVLFLTVPVFWIGLNLAGVIPERSQAGRWFASQGWVQVLIVLPLLISAWFGCLWLWFVQAGALASWDLGRGLSLSRWLGDRWAWWAELGFTGHSLELASWAFLIAIFYSGVWFLSVALEPAIAAILRRPRPVHALRMSRAVILFAPVAGAVGGALLWLTTFCAHGLRELHLELGSSAFPAFWNLLHVIVWMPPMLVAAMAITAFFHTALLGRALPDGLRQWWIRFGAWLLIYSTAWLLVFGVALYGPVLLALVLSVNNVPELLSTGWVISTVTGILVGRMQPGGEGKARAWVRALTRAAPILFAVGLLALATVGIHAVLTPRLDALTPPAISQEDIDRHRPECDFLLTPPGSDEEEDLQLPRVFACHAYRVWTATTPTSTLGLLALVTALVLVLGWRIDINESSRSFSLRDRLIRTYLGASNERRRPERFTGFDSEDDIALADLSASRGYDGPYPIYNASASLVTGQELAWQDHRAAPFAFAPDATGLETREDVSEPLLALGGYRPTASYRQTEHGLTLGTAMAISGAEEPPGGTGDPTSLAALFLAVFNAQPGWWLGNPLHRRTWPQVEPRVGILALIQRIFGFSDERSRYLFVSGARPFESLGIYELVRRRCKVILVSDADPDPALAMVGLGRSIRRCRTDLGVEIELDVSDLRKDPDTGRSRRHFAVGRIRYDRMDPGAAPGTLIYWKPSLTGDEPPDVEAHHEGNPAFPQDFARDQRFSEEQFESYRSLGEHIALSVFSRT